MYKKGLCDTCVHDNNCVFQKRLPVLECEEFINPNHSAGKLGFARQKKTERLEETIEE